jgi:hypothetical protein
VEASASLRLREVSSAWWPLALSWLMMGAEQPAVAAIVARLPDPELGLAAYGSVVFPIALVIEAPVIMLLAASTELSRDRTAYRALLRFSHQAGAVLTLIHALVALTPIGVWLMEAALSVPPDVAEAARPGLVLMLPWTWAIAWRRTGQGLLIRRGRSRLVGVGTGVRLLASSAVLAAGYLHRDLSGVMVGAAALSVGVLAEAFFVAAMVRRIARDLPEGDPDAPPLRGRLFAAFYVPLALTPVVVLVIQPVGTAAIGRMPEVLASLAVWPVVIGLAFVLQSVGIAYNEVVVALLQRPGARLALRRFAVTLAGIVTGIWTLLAFTPLSELWFQGVIGLSPELSAMAITGMAIALPVPACRVIQSWYQGLLVAARRTRAITEAVVVYAIVFATTLGIGVAWQGAAGFYVTIAGFMLGRVFQTVWLLWRARAVATG